MPGMAATSILGSSWTLVPSGIVVPVATPSDFTAGYRKLGLAMSDEKNSA
jgi:hypothetical protein